VIVEIPPDLAAAVIENVTGDAATYNPKSGFVWKV
jgi:hypothetical protein